MAVINGTSGDDILNGGAAADQIFGFAGNDILNGNGGNDQLDGGTGSDTMTGGTGNDIYFVDDVGDSVIESAGQGTDEVRTTLATYALGANVERLRFTGSGSFTGTGNALNNELHGGASGDTLSGGDGYDYLVGNGGTDSLYGGADGDTLDGGSGADYLEGNDGNDVYLVDNVGDTVVEAANEGIDEIFTSLSSYTLGANFEDLYFNAGSGNFTGTGNAADNDIHGGSGADTLTGLDGNDELDGGTNNDTLSGGDGDDRLYGNSGTDDLTGGNGDDTFAISGFQTGLGASADRILDFVQGEDIIDVSGMDANLLSGGNQAFSFIGTGAFSGASAELRYFFDGTDTWIQGDINGDGAADFEIFVSNAVTLTATDFVL